MCVKIMTHITISRKICALQIFFLNFVCKKSGFLVSLSHLDSHNVLDKVFFFFPVLFFFSLALFFSLSLPTVRFVTQWNGNKLLSTPVLSPSLFLFFLLLSFFPSPVFSFFLRLLFTAMASSHIPAQSPSGVKTSEPTSPIGSPAKSFSPAK